MQNIQTYLTMGGLVLLSLTSLRFNSAILETSTTDIENKVYLTAFSLADDLIEEIKTKSFDETTKDFPVANTGSLTAVSLLGPEYGELYSNYDDIDDFNNYTNLIDAPHAEGYNISCTVHYVNKDDQDVISSEPTFYKKVTSTVASPYMRTPITLSFIFTLK